jgi:hypothetical protein
MTGRHGAAVACEETDGLVPGPFRNVTHAGSDDGTKADRTVTNRSGGGPVATYRMIYGDEETVAEETLDDIDSIEHEDGWIVLFRGDDAVLRVQEDHVQSLELVTEEA